MLSNRVQAIVLAAGKSTRFNTGRTKLLEKICGQEMILYITRLLESFNIPVSIVIGYQKDAIKDIINHHHRDSINFVVQEEQKGTGHAIMCTQDVWEKEHILIMNGDVPLVTHDILEKLYERHISNHADISFVTSHYADGGTSSYGRVIKTENSIQIVEACELQGDGSEYCCINAGIYLIRKTFLERCIKSLTLHATAKEFFVTDLVKMASDQGGIINTISAPFDRVRGINNLQELWAAEHIKRADLIKHWMERGVHFSIAQNVHIDLNVTLGPGTYIGCGVHLLGNTRIGKNSKIHEFTSLENVTIGDNVEVYPHCIVANSRIQTHAKVGPFAHVREQSVIEESAIVGNFVEIKNSVIGCGTKIKHLSYLGDSEFGENVNVGAGTITCNYNGASKHRTIVQDNVFIGSNNTLVAPLTIEKDAFTAAGSVITNNVPANALAIARARQVNKEGYAVKLRDTGDPELLEYPDNATPTAFLGAVKTRNDHTSDPEFS